ncbi:hypothetical protein J4Q44_G00008260, partial [Coregonus suidteri]
MRRLFLGSDWLWTELSLGMLEQVGAEENRLARAQGQEKPLWREPLRSFVRNTPDLGSVEQ